MKIFFAIIFSFTLAISADATLRGQFAAGANTGKPRRAQDVRAVTPDICNICPGTYQAAVACYDMHDLTSNTGSCSGADINDSSSSDSGEESPESSSDSGEESPESSSDSAEESSESEEDNVFGSEHERRRRTQASTDLIPISPGCFTDSSTGDCSSENPTGEYHFQCVVGDDYHRGGLVLPTTILSTPETYSIYMKLSNLKKHQEDGNRWLKLIGFDEYWDEGLYLYRERYGDIADLGFYIEFYDEAISSAPIFSFDASADIADLSFSILLTRDDSTQLVTIYLKRQGAAAWEEVISFTDQGNGGNGWYHPSRPCYPSAPIGMTCMTILMDEYETDWKECTEDGGYIDHIALFAESIDPRPNLI